MIPVDHPDTKSACVNVVFPFIRYLPTRTSGSAHVKVGCVLKIKRRTVSCFNTSRYTFNIVEANILVERHRKEAKVELHEKCSMEDPAQILYHQLGVKYTARAAV